MKHCSIGETSTRQNSENDKSHESGTAVQKDANLVELEKRCQTHIFLQNFILIQLRTSPPKICKICQKNMYLDVLSLLKMLILPFPPPLPTHPANSRANKNSRGLPAPRLLRLRDRARVQAQGLRRRGDGLTAARLEIEIRVSLIYVV